MKPIHFGVVGTGAMAATMMEAFGKVPDAKVVAVASESLERARSFGRRFGIENAYGRLDDLLSDGSVDAVYVANATESHAGTTIEALRAGKAVLCEKPIATTEADCRRIQEVAASTGRPCMEAMWTHFLPAYQELFRINESQALGRPVQLYADFGYPASPEAYPRLFKRSAGSGVLLDRGVYPIALAVKLLGRVVDVQARVVFNPDGVDTDAYLILAHENGCHSQLATSIRVLQQNRAILSCTSGTASLEPPVVGAETLVVQRVSSGPPSHGSEVGLRASLKQRLRRSAVLRRIKSKHGAGISQFHSFGTNQYIPMLSHFCGFVREERRESDVVPLSLSGDVLRVVDEVRRSAPPSRPEH